MAENRIAIVDDETAIAELVAKVARTCGYEAKTFDDAAMFLKECEVWRPTHLVLDLHMPGVDGIELMRKLAERHSEAQILIMSGFDARVLQSAARLGVERGLKMAGTIAKPARVAELQAILNKIKVA